MRSIGLLIHPVAPELWRLEGEPSLRQATLALTLLCLMRGGGWTGEESIDLTPSRGEARGNIVQQPIVEEDVDGEGEVEGEVCRLGEKGREGEERRECC